MNINMRLHCQENWDIMIPKKIRNMGLKALLTQNHGVEVRELRPIYMYLRKFRIIKLYSLYG